MDPASIAAALIGARTGELQTEFAAKMLKMNADAGHSAVKLIDAAQQNIDQLANVASGIGGNLDLTV